MSLTRSVGSLAAASGRPKVLMERTMEVTREIPSFVWASALGTCSLKIVDVHLVLEGPSPRRRDPADRAAPDTLQPNLPVRPLPGSSGPRARCPGSAGHRPRTGSGVLILVRDAGSELTDGSELLADGRLGARAVGFSSASHDLRGEHGSFLEGPPWRYGRSSVSPVETSTCPPGGCPTPAGKRCWISRGGARHRVGERPPTFVASPLMMVGFSGCGNTARESLLRW